jgi:hypothetical protein
MYIVMQELAAAGATSRVGNKKPAQKNPPNKTQKNPPKKTQKNPPQSGFYWVFLDQHIFYVQKSLFSCNMSVNKS